MLALFESLSQQTTTNLLEEILGSKIALMSALTYAMGRLLLQTTCLLYLALLRAHGTDADLQALSFSDMCGASSTTRCNHVLSECYMTAKRIFERDLPDSRHQVSAS